MDVQRSKDPSRFILQHEPAEEHKIALGLDLGTLCGYAYAVCRPDGTWETNPWYMGLWDLSTGRYDTGNLGFLRLRCFLAEVRPSIVFYEDVKFTPSEAISKYNASRVMARAATSSELIGAFKQTLCLWCEDHGVHCTGIPIDTIKNIAFVKDRGLRRV